MFSKKGLIIGAILGAITGKLMSSEYYYFGIMLIAVILIIFRNRLGEVIEAFTFCEAQKVSSTLFITIVVIAIIISDFITGTLIRIVFLVLLLIAFLLILKLMILITDYELNIDLKNIELNHSIPLTTHWKR